MSERKKTTSQKHAELKHLSKQAKDSLYQRLKLTHEILADVEYVDTVWGNVPAAIEALERGEWCDFSADPGLKALLDAYDANPQQSTWSQHGYSFRAMILLATPESEPAQRSEPKRWKQMYEEIKSRLDAIERENESLKRENELLRELAGRKVVAA